MGSIKNKRIDSTTDDLPSAKHLYQVFTQTPMPLAITKGASHVYELANDPYRAFFNGRALLGKSAFDAIPELKGQGPLEMVERVYKTGRPLFISEFKVYLSDKKGGSAERYFNFMLQPLRDSHGRRYGVLHTGFEVTQQIEAIRDLRTSEERLRLALKAGNMGVWDWDIATNHIEWSEQIYKMHGLKRDSFGGTVEDFSKLIHDEDAKVMTDAIQNAVRKNGSFQKEFRIKHPDGKTRWLFTEGQAVTGTGKKQADRMLGATVDITNRKELERQKDDFIAIATHELKTPVTSIKGYTQVLENRLKKYGDDDTAKHLAKMDAQIDKLTSLISDLLDVTKVQAGKLYLREEKFAFDSLVNDIVDEMQRTTNRHTLIQRGGTKKKVYADRDRISQVLTNLLANAIKYSPHTGKIIVKSSVEKGGIKLSVRDYGVGISKNKLNRVFERFYRVSGPRSHTFPGLGLGLYISSEIIKRHGGKIWVESSKGKGSTFCFTLPI